MEETSGMYTPWNPERTFENYYFRKRMRGLRHAWEKKTKEDFFT